MKKKVSRLEHFVGDLKKSIVSLKEGETNTLLTSEAATLGEKGMLGTAGGEVREKPRLLPKLTFFVTKIF